MEQKTFILIHGSWHCAWNWYKVTPLLERQGHKVCAMDLPGMGRDKTPIEKVNFKDTVAKVCELIDRAEGKVILVGHSKNGIVISQAAEHRPDKIEKLIYLAAYLIPDGKTQSEYSAQDTTGWLKPYVTMDHASGSHTLQQEIYREGLYHDCEEGIAEMARVLLGAEPMESGLAPLHLSEEKFGRVPRYYIACDDDRAVTPFIQEKMYTETPCRKVYHMQASHSPFFSKPDELVDIFLEIAGEAVRA
ncbi:MAG: alpha/beta fold hydrolase [Flavobacteriales bacterium]|nr:alpha/beta fold hydrolase [Flavobacteriales bacterium]MCB9449207.1 alpha/beta fold hydrolase [Flavobacteriales bacterium]